MSFELKWRFRPLLWQTPLVIFFWLVYFSMLVGFDYFQNYDAPMTKYYAASVEEGFFTDSAIPPYNRRILFPLIAKAINPLTRSTLHSFLLINIVSLVLCIPLLRKYAKQLGLTDAQANNACLFFLLSFGFNSIRYYGVPDALLAALILASLTCSLSGKALLASIALAATILTKDGCILLLPCTALYLWKSGKSGNRILGVATMCLITFAIFLPLNILLPASHYSSDDIEYVLSLFGIKGTSISISRFLLYGGWSLCYSLGPLWVLMLLAVRKQKRFIAQSFFFWCPFLLPVLMASDTERMLSLLFPVVIPLAVSIFPKEDKVSVLFTAICLGMISASFLWTHASKNILIILLLILPTGVYYIRRKKHYSSEPINNLALY